MAQAHHEVNLETYIVQKLVENGWRVGNPEHYDRERALYPEDIKGWLQDSQSETWAKLEKLNNGGSLDVLVSKLDKALGAKTGGTLNVLRDGINIAGVGKILMSQSAPEDKNNPNVEQRYLKNRLTVIRQLKYDPTRELAIDLGLFINGIPVGTIEVKTDFTQSIDDAVAQYKLDRLPIDPSSKRKHPLLTFKRGAVVHFAMSDSEIQMATHLQGADTHFLPFNKGNEGHAGNAPRKDGEYPVAYFWEEVCTFDNWLRLFHSFVYVETSNKVDKHGHPYKAETLIFPRYHQMDAVNKMLAHVKAHGPGQQYLFEHSAGSGKTSTISWTAHDLIKIRHEDGTPYFNSVIIVTDRTVLDSQLQDAVQQLDHQFGVIEAIDKQQFGKSKSKRLAEALKNGVPIIVVTIQTFPHAMEAILNEQSLKDRNFAVIIDEAHNSQTGNTAQGLRAALSLDSTVKLEEMTIEEVLLEIQKSRVRPDNVSHFAFTATPKHSTMTLFGQLPDPDMPASEDNKPESFHRYTQRQAIEEHFILDVLQGYTPYKEAYRLGEQGLNDKRVDKKMAKKALARWKTLHPTNVTQKVEFIANHFTQSVLPLLDGEAKAMIVTSGRPQAVKYKLAFDKYIKKHKLENIKALVAFSGKVPGKDLGMDDPQAPLGFDVEEEYTEYNMNPDVSGQDLRNAFDETQYNVMIVANKFQTGFNQPKLVAMYLDKKISGVEAVQTLSRLNRTYPGKDQTFVIDFVNDPKTILDAFKMYDDGAELEEVQDLDVIYEMKDLLDAENIYNQADLDAFMKARGKAVLRSEDETLHKKLYFVTQRPTDVFNARMKQLNEAISEWDKQIDKAQAAGDEKALKIAESKRSSLSEERESHKLFKARLGRFTRTYNYIAQLIELGDAELENFAAFAKLLSRRLDGVPEEQVDISGIVLTHFEIKALNSKAEGDKETLKPLTANDSEPVDREKELLSTIIDRLNEIFGDISDHEGRMHFTNQVVDIAKTNENVSEQVSKNTKEQALHGDLPDVVTQGIVKAMTSHSELARVLLKDPQTMTAYVSLVYDIMKNSQTQQP